MNPHSRETLWKEEIWFQTFLQRFKLTAASLIRRKHNMLHSNIRHLWQNTVNLSYSVRHHQTVRYKVRIQCLDWRKQIITIL